MSDVFISHVEKDSDIALEIALGLEEAGFTTWCYELDTIPGPSYLVQTGQAVEQCKAVVVLISPHSLGSRQVTIEIVRAHESNKDFIPVLRGITHVEFQSRQPEWREAMGSAASIRIIQEKVASILTRIIVGLKALGIQPLSKPKAARITMLKRALGIHEEEPARPTPKVEAKKPPPPREPARPAEGVKVGLPQCPECGAKLRPKAVFCNKCGARVEERELARPTERIKVKKTPVPRQPTKPAGGVKVELPQCPECGAKLRPNATFCNKCGARVGMGEKES